MRRSEQASGMGLPGSSAQFVKVKLWTEKISATGNITVKSFTDVFLSESVRGILRRLCPPSSSPTPVTPWSQYRVAYGVRLKEEEGGRLAKLDKLQWAARIARYEYDPSVQELFKDIDLEPDQCYCLVLSRLDVGLKDPSIRDSPGNLSNIYACWVRYSALYVWPRTPRPPDGGGSRRRLEDSLAALQALQF